MDKTAIYTCIVGAYDDLLQPVALEAGFDFICFVGQREKRAERIGAWEIRELPSTFGAPTLDARWAKTHPHVLLPEYACSVWIDGNIALLDGSLFQAVRERTAAGAVFSGVPHPLRDCSYAEAWKCFKLKYLSIFRLLRVWLFLATHGLRRHAGLMESNLLFRRHTDPAVVEMDELWWDRILHLSRRDQLSQRWCLQRCGIAWDDRLLGGRHTRNHPGFRYLKHK